MPRAGLSSISGTTGELELILTAPPDPARTRALLLDIEGTTTPIDFVYGTLFPFARARVEQFLRESSERDDVQADIEALRQEHTAEALQAAGLPPWRDDSPEASIVSAVSYVNWLMERDRKSTALKSLQGKIWEEGYRSGQLRGQVYADVAPALARWRRQGKAIGIFSSGSILAQKLLFGNSTAGDLTPYIDFHFDTSTGPKQEGESYRRIAAGMNLSPAQVLFLSDVLAELEAARCAGMETALCVRPGHPGGVELGGTLRIVRSFDEVFP